MRHVIVVGCIGTVFGVLGAVTAIWMGGRVEVSRQP